MVQMIVLSLVDFIESSYYFLFFLVFNSHSFVVLHTVLCISCVHEVVPIFQ